MDPFVQSLVAKGFVVLRPNYRGSTGYGKTFREANRFVMGDLDLADCVSGRDFLIERNLADPERIGVTGGLVRWIPDDVLPCQTSRWLGMWFSFGAVSKLVHGDKNEREELRFWDLENMGDPEKDEERLHNASPIFYIDKIKTPVLLLAGANDPRCPVEESEQAREELVKHGRPVELKVYADEGHGFRKTKNRVDAYSSIIAFLEKNISNKKIS